jgi:uroporphyrinogen decarboxylase
VAELSDWRAAVQPPVETLPADTDGARDTVNRACAASPLFMQAAASPRPWERLQFLRGTVNAMLDVMEPDSPDLRGLLARIHGFYLRELEFWVRTDVDSIMFMDDWGAQSQLLIPPPIWRTLFRPLYRDYCDLAHSHGKFAFMHSDGHIAAIYPDLIEVGVDAVNSQLFCMDLSALARHRGRITFWGEIDRQHVLSSPDAAAGRRAVWQVAEHLYDPRGGLIAQCEAGPGTNPAVCLAVFEAWDEVARTWNETRRSGRTPLG